MLKFVENSCGHEYDAEKARKLAVITGLSEPAARLLYGRGITDPAEAKRFFNPGPEQFLDPFLLPDMEGSVRRVKEAIAQKERITVFCDYDADGTCGGCSLYLHLKNMGAQVSIMTPNRHKEGYGLSLEAVESIAASGTKLIVTVDCGITNIAETAYARSLGVDVIITDHHECGELPDTPYIINAKRPGSNYPYPYLAGCGVAFKLIQALSSLSDAMRYIDLAAVGTITDIVPLLGENRVISYLGLRKLRKDPSAGLAALAEAAGLKLPQLNSFGVSFGLGPRINAAGRMDTASLAIDILSASEPSAELRENAKKLCALNERRRKEVEDIEKEAEEIIRRNEYMKDSAIVAADMRWNAGVIGIAAAKISERYTRPCILFGGNGESLVGSARSIEGINIFEALSAFADRFEKFGGHSQAAGLTIAPNVLDGLRRDLCTYINENYSESIFEPVKQYDIELKVGDISRKLVEDISKLEPFGPCNERPSIAIFGAEITGVKNFGNGRKPHIKFQLRQGGDKAEAVSFFFEDSHSFGSKRCDALCEAEIDDYSGLPRLIVRDIIMKYDMGLSEGFLEANRERMARNFIEEVSGIGSKANDRYIGEREFVQQLEKEIASSRFGLCILAETAPALRRLIKIDAVSKALQKGDIALFDDKAYSADNCIACHIPPGFNRIMRTGIFNSKDINKLPFLDEGLYMDYISYAESIFAPREELLRFYRLLCSGDSFEFKEIQAKSSAGFEKVLFMVKVLEELELIETDKSGRIHPIKNSPRKDLRQSACFRGFEDLIRGPQKI